MRLIAALLLATLTLAACGEDPAPPRAAGEGFPVTVRHKFGTTTVPRAPERVVTAGYTDQDAVLALGVVPVGVGDFLGGYDWRARPWAQAALHGARPTVVSGQQINFEAVAAQRPDLIIAINAGLKRGDYERLSQIAPTVAQSGGYIDFGMPWEAQTRLVGRALGRSARADRLITGVHEQFRRFRAAHPAFAGQTAVLAYGGPDGYGAYATGDTRSRFLSDLGFKTPRKIDALAGRNFYVQFSQERFRLLDQDLVVMYGKRSDILANPVFRRLDAVREDRVIYLDTAGRFAGALGFASALSLPYLLDAAEDALVAAADGDPGTPVPQPD